jgi:hypothetical protein
MPNEPETSYQTRILSIFDNIKSDPSAHVGKFEDIVNGPKFGVLTQGLYSNNNWYLSFIVFTYGISGFIFGYANFIPTNGISYTYYPILTSLI